MTIRNVKENKNVNIHSNAEKTKAGSRHYIHAEMSQMVLFLLEKNTMI